MQFSSFVNWMNSIYNKAVTYLNLHWKANATGYDSQSWSLRESDRVCGGASVSGLLQHFQRG